MVDFGDSEAEYIHVPEGVVNVELRRHLAFGDTISITVFDVCNWTSIVRVFIPLLQYPF